MRRLWVAAQGDELLEASPEFRFLARVRETELRAVFEHVQEGVVGSLSDDSKLPATDSDFVLLVDPDVLVLRGTLARLVRLLEENRAAWAAPGLLSDLGAVASRIHTLGAFERLEMIRLARQPDPTERARPISLWRSRDFARARSGAASLEGLVATTGPGLEIGLAHKFDRYYGQLRSDVAPILPAGIRRVLEVGCAEGLTGEWLEKTYGCRVTGLELNPVAAAAARRRLSRVWVGDVERIEIPEQFDLILALELFEHLADPWRFLERVRTWLDPEGYLLLSVPNVGAAPILEELLAGRFDYIPVGLLCVTHLRFFTRKSLAAIIEQAGFEQVEFFPQPGADARALLEAARAVGLEADEASLEALGYWVRARLGR